MNEASLMGEEVGNEGGSRSHLEPHTYPCAAIISAMPVHTIEPGDNPFSGKILPIVGADVSLRLFVTVEEYEPFSSRVVEIQEGDKELTSEMRAGLKSLQRLQQRDGDAAKALEFLLTKFYLAVRQQGAEAAAEKFLELIKTEKV